MSELLGQVIGGRYRILEELDRGQKSLVYRAEQLQVHDRSCAIKVLRAGLMDLDAEVRLEREVELLSRLRSPNIVRILDTGRLEDGRRYLVTELLRGLPLSKIMQDRQPLPLKRALKIFQGVISGLADAHSEGIIHRDLQPNNLFLIQLPDGGEHAILLDFGLSREARDNTDLTTMGALIGTPTHMAPEQFRGGSANTHTDLYAAGILLYRMIVGEPPFTALASVPPEVSNLPSVLRIGWMHLCSPAPAIPELPPKIAALLRSLLAKEPDERPESARRVLAQLSEISVGEETSPRLSPLSESSAEKTLVQKPRSSGPSAQILLAILILLMGLSLLLLIL